jgi:hypothetical protein
LNEAEKNRKKAAVGRGMQGMQLERGTTCSESLNCGNLGISQPPMFDAGELLLKALIAITSITVSLMDSNGVLTDKKKETHCTRIFKTSFAIVTSNFSAF